MNYLGILLATVAQFIVGAVWYSFLFGKMWGRIHGFDKLPKNVQNKMVKEMGPFYGIQFLVTVITTIILAYFKSLENINLFYFAFLIWFGFIVPAQISAVIFGGTDKKWIVKKVLVQSGAALVCLEFASLILLLVK